MAFLVRIVLIALLCAIVSSSTVAQTQLKIKLGVIPSDFAGEAYYAQELGFFKAAGLDVEITSLTNGAAIAAAVASGAVDIGYASVIPLITGHDHGLPFTIVSPDDLAISKAPTGGILAVLKGSPVRSARDLEGKTVGIDGLNNLAWLAVRNWIDTNGGRSDLVRFVELPWWQMPAALQAHTVDAASTNQVSDPDIGKPDDSLRLLANVFGSIAPRFASGAWISTNDWVAKHPDAAKTFTAVMRRTAAWANIHHHETAAILAKYLNQTPAQIERATRVTYTTEIDPTLLQPAIDVAVKYHVIRAPFPARDLISSSAQ